MAIVLCITELLHNALVIEAGQDRVKGLATHRTIRPAKMPAWRGPTSS